MTDRLAPLTHDDLTIDPQILRGVEVPEEIWLAALEISDASDVLGMEEASLERMVKTILHLNRP